MCPTTYRLKPHRRVPAASSSTPSSGSGRASRCGVTVMSWPEDSGGGRSNISLASSPRLGYLIWQQAVGVALDWLHLLLGTGLVVWPGRWQAHKRGRPPCTVDLLVLNPGCHHAEKRSDCVCGLIAQACQSRSISRRSPYHRTASHLPSDIALTSPKRDADSNNRKKPRKPQENPKDPKRALTAASRGA